MHRKYKKRYYSEKFVSSSKAMRKLGEMGRLTSFALVPSGNFLLDSHSVWTVARVAVHSSWKRDGSSVLSSTDGVKVVVDKTVSVLEVLHVALTLFAKLLLLVPVHGHLLLVHGLLLLLLLLGEVGLEWVDGNVLGQIVSVLWKSWGQVLWRVSVARVSVWSQASGLTVDWTWALVGHVTVTGDNVLAWWVSAAILSEVDLESLVLLTVTNSLDSLNSVGNIGEVNKSTALLAESVDEFDLSVLSKVLSEALLTPALIEITDVDVSGSATGDSQGDSWWESARMLAPSNLESSVVNHETLKVAESVETGGGSWVDEGNEANVLVWNVANVMKKTSTDNVANLLNSSLRMDVTQVDSAVTQVVHSTGGSGNGGSGNGLLSKGGRDDLAISTAQDMGVSWGNSEVLSSILLLSLGNIGASILSVVDASWSLPLSLLWELSDGLDGVANGEEMDETNGLLADQLNGVNWAKLSKILSDLLLGNIFWKVTQVDISGGTILLNGQCDRGWDWRWLSPSDLDILSSNGQLLQDGIRVEVSSRGAIQERDESTVLVWQKTNRLNLSRADMTEDLLSSCFSWDVSKVHGSRGSRDNSRSSNHWRSSWRCLSIEVGVLGWESSWRHETSTTESWRQSGRWVLLEVAHWELLRVKSIWSSWLERRAQEQLRWQQRGELHIVSTRGPNAVIALKLMLNGILELWCSVD